MSNQDFPADEFVARREKVYDAIGPSACALVASAGPVTGFSLFRQTNEFYYLAGLETPQAYLFLDARSRQTTLYLPPRDPHAASEGDVLGAEDAAELIRISGVDFVHELPALDRDLSETQTLYMPQAPLEARYECQDTLRAANKLIGADPWDQAPMRGRRLIDTIQAKYSALTIEDLTPILSKLRLIKSEREITLMRAAGALTGRAAAEAMRSTRAGVYEYQLMAVADYIYRMNGVRAEGYRAIIAGGENIWYAHYYRCDNVLRDGDMAIMDYAPDLRNYTSDIGRMWPVNGRFTAQQRELYGFMAEYHKAVLRYLRPGVTPQQVLDDAAADMAKVVEQTRFSKEIYEQAARRALSFKGHLSHPVGMAVHDVGKYFDEVLQPGLVIAVDPQMWVPEEKLYVRVEDTVALTSTGCEVLTTGAPFEIDEIEAIVGSGGIIQEFKMQVLPQSSATGAR